MSKVTRRELGRLAGGGLAAGAAAGLFPTGVIGQARPRVVVIGGGPGGGTAAKYIAMESDGAIDVTLVEPQRQYTTCFYSNLYLGGLWPFEGLVHDYETMAARHGVRVVHDLATGVDHDARTVRLWGGDELSYDRLVVAPGIDFRWDAIEGYGAEAAAVMPHSYKAGPQTRLLKSQLEAMEDGGTFLLSAPPMPYRCPPGPYERICMIAWYFKSHKPNSKILVLDSKGSFSKQALFTEAWNTYYPGMIEWIPAELGGAVEAVDLDEMVVVADGERHRVDVANIIPPQRAGRIAEVAGLTDETGWCPVVPETFASPLVDDTFVLGDATIATEMPKSAFSANSQAKVVAMTVRHELTGSRAFPPRFRNTCWSSVADGDAVKIGANYRPTEERLEAFEGFISETGESGQLRRETREEADAWYAGITEDIFA
jgi:sulfide dehydrogenase [flavocytochrome c] flavoprotein chain